MKCENSENRRFGPDRSREENLMRYVDCVFLVESHFWKAKMKGCRSTGNDALEPPSCAMARGHSATQDSRRTESTISQFMRYQKYLSSSWNLKSTFQIDFREFRTCPQCACCRARPHTESTDGFAHGRVFDLLQERATSVYPLSLSLSLSLLSLSHVLAIDWQPRTENVNSL